MHVGLPNKQLIHAYNHALEGAHIQNILAVLCSGNKPLQCF